MISTVDLVLGTSQWIGFNCPLLQVVRECEGDDIISPQNRFPNLADIHVTCSLHCLVVVVSLLKRISIYFTLHISANIRLCKVLQLCEPTIDITK